MVNKHDAVILMGDFNEWHHCKWKNTIGCMVWFLEEKFEALTSPLPLPEQLLTPPANHWIIMSTSPVTQDEVHGAVFSLTNGKAVSANGIHGEYLKALPSDRARLLEIINEFWCTEEMPEDWSLVILNHAAQENLNNYRAMCLLSHSYKVLSSILLRRIAVVDNTIPDCQNGFRPERGCREYLYILREVSKDRAE